MSPGNPIILGSKGQRSRWRLTEHLPAWGFALLWVQASGFVLIVVSGGRRSSCIDRPCGRVPGSLPNVRRPSQRRGPADESSTKLRNPIITDRRRCGTNCTTNYRQAGKRAAGSGNDGDAEDMLSRLLKNGHHGVSCCGPHKQLLSVAFCSISGLWESWTVAKSYFICLYDTAL